MKRRRRRSISSQLGIKRSVSSGPKGSKFNLSSRGMRVSTKNPISGKRKSKMVMSTKRKRSGAGCMSFLVLVVVVGVAWLVSSLLEGVGG